MIVQEYDPVLVWDSSLERLPVRLPKFALPYTTLFHHKLASRAHMR